MSIEVVEITSDQLNQILVGEESHFLENRVSMPNGAKFKPVSSIIVN